MQDASERRRRRKEGSKEEKRKKKGKVAGTCAWGKLGLSAGTVGCPRVLPSQTETDYHSCLLGSLERWN